MTKKLPVFLMVSLYAESVIVQKSPKRVFSGIWRTAFYNLDGPQTPQQQKNAFIVMLNTSQLGLTRTPPVVSAYDFYKAKKAVIDTISPEEILSIDKQPKYVNKSLVNGEFMEIPLTGTNYSASGEQKKQ